MNATTIVLDIAKNVFQVHGVDGAGKPVLRKQLKRKDVLAFFANLSAALSGRVCEQGERGAEITVRLPLPHHPRPLPVPV